MHDCTTPSRFVRAGFAIVSCGSGVAGASGTSDSDPITDGRFVMLASLAGIPVDNRQAIERAGDRMRSMEEHAPASSDAPANFENAITVREAEERFRGAGVWRHEKSIERYCRLKQLRSIRQVGGSGEFLIDPTSVDELIVYLKQIHGIKSTRPQAPASSAVLLNENPGNSSEQAPNMLPRAGATADAIGAQNQEEQAGAGSGMRRYVEQLEIRISEKDRAIDFLQEELKDRRDQIKGMRDFMEQNHGLLATINGNIAPIFKAIATTLRPATAETADKETDTHIIEPKNPYTSDPGGN